MFAVSYNVKLEGFEGPLDLLLQLVEKEKVNIFEVSLSKITDEYLATLEAMRRANLEVGGDFVVVAAQLAYIKSRLLLPPDPVQNPEEPSAEELKRSFLERLAAYRIFQEAAKELGKKDLLGRDVFLRGIAGAEEPPEPELSVELYSLLTAFEAVLKRAKLATPHEVVFRRLSLTDRIHQVLDRLRTVRSMSFDALFEDAVDTQSLIITFMSILELAKLKLLSVSQEDRGQPILLSLKEGSDEAS